MGTFRKGDKVVAPDPVTKRMVEGTIVRKQGPLKQPGEFPGGYLIQPDGPLSPFMATTDQITKRD